MVLEWRGQALLGERIWYIVITVFERDWFLENRDATTAERVFEGTDK